MMPKMPKDAQSLLVSLAAHLDQYGVDGEDFDVSYNKENHAIKAEIFHSVVVSFVFNPMLKMAEGKDYELHAIINIERGIAFLYTVSD